MATTFAGKLAVDLNIGITDAGTLSTIVDRLMTGSASFAAIEKSLTNGTTANAANRIWYQRRSILTTANDDLDLAALTDRKGIALVFAKIKWLLLRIVTPATGVFLNVGGSGPANPWSAMYADPTDKTKVFDLFIHVNQIDGGVVDATNKVLRLNNPGATTVSYDLVLVGNA